MTAHAVVIAGAGPTGLMLAGELALAKVDVAIVEPRANQDLDGARARGLHARTIEVLDQRGIADRFLSEGRTAQIGSFAEVPLDISDFPTRHNYGLALLQKHFERILAGWVRELAVPIHREREVTGFAQNDRGVDVALSDGQSLRADYLVGCDGGRSLVRAAAGIEFPGWDPSTSNLIAEAVTAEEPEFGIHHDEKGIHAIGPLEDRQGWGSWCAKKSSGEPTSPPSVTSARRSSPRAGPTMGCTAPDGSPGSPMRRGKPPPTGTEGCCWPATLRTSIRRPADKA